MNQKLQNIIETIQQSEKLDTEQKDNLVKAVKDADKELEITAFKLERTEKVKKTTAILLEETIEELEQKRKAVEEQNLKLEIEAALERVRSVAMGMREPSDMLDVCKTISLQLESLGVKEIRNVQTAIFYQERGTYMNYEYYAKHNKTVVTETTYTNNKLHEEFASNMIKGKGEIFITHIKDGEVKDWIAYQKTTNVFIDKYLETASSLNYYWFSLGPVALGISTYYPLTEEEIILFKRFLNVFELAYRRYLDIEKAEAQAREAQIQLALERVRARTMAMQKSEELQEVVHTVLERLKDLNVEFYTAIIILFTENLKDIIWWLENKEKQQYSRILVPYTNITYLRDLFDARENGRNHFSKTYSFEEKNELFQHLFSTTDFQYVPEKQRKFLLDSQAATMSVAIAKNTGIHLTRYTDKPFSDEDNEILKRFVKVFEQSYVRFLDLQKAEAQAREAEIELALERVRSRSLAMHKSKDLEIVITILLQQLEEVGILLDTASIVIPSKDKKTSVDWTASKKYKYSKGFIVPFMENGKPALSGEINRDMVAALKSGKEFTKSYSKKEKNKYFQNLFDKSGFSETPEERKEFLLSLPGISVSTAGSKNSYIQIFSYSGEELSDADLAVLKRFAMVFEQCYVRFQDLEKAEAQAREAQIEAALERVRSRTMGMQKSEELAETASLLFKQIGDLGLDVWSSGFQIWNADDISTTAWMSTGGGTITAGLRLPYTEDPFFQNIYNARHNADGFFVMESKGKELEETYKYMFNIPEWKKAFGDIEASGFPIPTYQITHCVFFPQGYLMLITHKPYPEYWDIFKRFGKVFEQTYTRFLDLQKAEAQAREAKIEAALERVRSRSVAMRKSEEIADIAAKIFGELRQLDLALNRVLIWTFNDIEKYTTWWSANPEVESTAESYRIDYNENPVFINYLQAWQQRKPIHLFTLSGDTKKIWEDHLFEHTEMSRLPIAVRKGMRAEGTLYTVSVISDYGLMMSGSFEPLAEVSVDIIQRFGRVFQQSYTRYQDVQKAEIQAKEAIKQASLDRVRGEIASMRTAEDLNRITPIIWRELKSLEVPFIRCGVFIVDEENEKVQVYLTTPDGKSLGVLNLSSNVNELTRNTVDHWKKKQIYREHWNTEEFINWTKSMMELGQVQNAETYQGSSIPPESLDLHFVPFTQGMLYVGNVTPLTEEKLRLVKSLSEAFSIAYARYEDFQRLEVAKEKVESAYSDLDNLSKELQVKNEQLEIENNRKAIELEEARQLQLSMLPKVLPALPDLDIAVSMETATEVGGDYYDFQVGIDGTLTTIIGDATGHGMKAGTVVTITKSLFNSMAENENILSAFDKISQVIKGMKFRQLSMCLLMMKIRGNRLSISSAAMPPPLIYRAKNSSVEEIFLSGMPLGSMKKFPYKKVESHLYSGDTILLYSDGLPELANDKGQMFSYDRTRLEFHSVAEKKPEEVVNHLKNSAFKWVNGKGYHDDVTFVVIKVK